jgi:hypothetical protein
MLVNDIEALAALSASAIGQSNATRQRGSDQPRC